MDKKPYMQAILAFGYVVLIGSIMPNLKYIFPHQDPVLAPVMVLSLFVLSAVIMGYLFLALPIQLYLDGNKKQAVDTFYRTVGTFAVLTMLVWISAIVISLA